MSRHGAVELDWADGTYTFRLGLAEIEEVEEKRDLSLFALAQRLSPDVRDARLADIREVLRLGLVGGGMKPVDALAKVRKYVDERPLDENRDGRLCRGAVWAFAGQQCGGSSIGGSGRGGDERIDFAAIRGAATVMGVQNVMSLSLGEWAAVVRGWNMAHGKDEVAPPTVEEFEAAMLMARGAD